MTLPHPPVRPPRSGRKPIEEPPSWRERLRATRHLPGLLRLVWEAHRGFSGLVVGLRALRALVPLAVLWVGKLIIDQVVALVGGGAAHRPIGDPTLEPLAWLLAVEFGLAVLGEVLAR